MRKHLYKVLDHNMSSPFQNYLYEIGKDFHCDCFNTGKDRDCSRGFYATDIDGLPYSFNITRKVFECSVWGREVEINQFKRRYENIRLLREVPFEEIKKLAEEKEQNVGYKLSEALFPIDPRLIQCYEASEEHIRLLNQWSSVWDSVGSSVRDSVGSSVRSSVRSSVWSSVWDSVGSSVWDSVRSSVRSSVWDSVRSSVWDSVWAYIGSLFPNIDQWYYINHEKGVYPYQSSVDLWKQGLVSSYDGKKWRLHSGQDMHIIYE